MEEDVQPLPTQQICDHRFHFVNEVAPILGLKPSQRQSIRSHVMKQYKQNQRRSKQGEKGNGRGTRGEGRTTRGIQHAAISRLEPVGDREFETDSTAPLEPWATGTGKGCSSADRQHDNISKPSPFRDSIDVSKQLCIGSIPLALRRVNSLMRAESSQRNFTHEALHSRCALCGARQSASNRNEQRGKDPMMTAAKLLWGASSLLQSLGAGRVDPFQSYPVDDSYPRVNELMDHSE